MRRVWVLLVIAGCLGRPDEDESHHPPICEPCPNQLWVTAQPNLTSEQLAHSTMEMCIDGTRCARATFDDAACKFGECDLAGAFSLAVRVTSPGALEFDAFADTYHETEMWSLTIRDGTGATLFSASATGTWTPMTGCNGTHCANLVLALL